MGAESEIAAYLDGLPDDRRAIVERVRAVVVDSLPDGYVESFAWGMIVYEVPMDRSGPTYNDKPLMYAGLASQKRHVSLYLSSVYADPERAEAFRQRYLATGRKPDMGKSCVRFRTLEELPLDLVAETIAGTPVDEFVAMYEAARG